MVIVAGHITVDPEQRESHLAGSMRIVEKARQADGCLDFAMTADLIDPGRVKHRIVMLSMPVAEYDIADVRPLSGKGKA